MTYGVLGITDECAASHKTSALSTKATFKLFLDLTSKEKS